MEITELMIGDIVQYLDGKKLITVVVVKVDGSGNVVRLKQKNGHKFNTTIDFLKPIPLTPEILEKNGIKWFCTEPSGRKTYCCNEPVVQCAYIPNSGWLISVGACGSIKVRFVEISKIQYVHELQHAFSICKINKQISLP